MSLSIDVGLSPGDIVRWGPSSPEEGHSPQFSAHAYYGHTSGWMKMPLGKKVGLGPRHIELIDGDPAPSPKGAQHPLFSAHVYCGHSRPSQLLLSCC